MRKEFVDSLLSIAEDERIVFLTGDLGFMALEPLREKLGKRFINAGVAEQGMLNIAAGMASKGFVPFVYSIAPFVTLRPYEQIRNNVCLHNLPVKIVGNGGGYGYGIMGATHHALEDIGALRILPGMEIFVPVFGDDVGEAVKELAHSPSPGYLRLGRGLTRPSGVTEFGHWRRIVDGADAVVVGIGPVIEGALELAQERYANRLSVWSVDRLPLTKMPDALLESIRIIGKLVVVEEHYAAGGIGEALACTLLKRLDRTISFYTVSAQGYPSGRYGSQRWHQSENGLVGDSFNDLITIILGESSVSSFAFNG